MAQTPDLQIEIIHPNGRRETRILAGAKKIANIGSHPANEIVLSGAGIAEFHAILDYRQTPIRYLALNANQYITHEISISNTDEPLKVGNYLLIFQEPIVQAVNASTTVTPSNYSPNLPVNATQVLHEFDLGKVYTQRPAPQNPLQLDKNIRIDVAERTQWINLGQTALWTLVITNIGTRTARFNIKLHICREVNDAYKHDEWFQLTPDSEEIVQIQPEQFNLNNQSTLPVTIKITPPRNIGSKINRAGWYRLRVIVESPDYSESHDSFVEFALRIRAHDAFDINQPSETFLTLKFRGQNKNQLILPVTNRGNRDLEVEISGIETERRGRVEFPKIKEGEKTSLGSYKFLLPADQQDHLIPVRIFPHKWYWMGIRRRRYDVRFTATTDDERRLSYEPVYIEHQALLNPWLVAFLILILAGLILWGIYAVLAPNLSDFSIVGNTKESIYQPGQPVQLTWNTATWWPKSMTLQESTGNNDSIPRYLSRDEINNQSVQSTIVQNSKYTLTLESRLASLPWVTNWISTTSIPVTLSPQISQPPNSSIAITTEPTSEFVIGAPVRVSWNLPTEVTTYTLFINEQPLFVNTPVPGQLQDTYEGTPQENTTYKVIGEIPFRSAVTAVATIKAKQPPPNIISFQAFPPEVVQGSSVTLTWQVEEKPGTNLYLDNNQTPYAQFSNEITVTIMPSIKNGTTQTFTLKAEYSGTQSIATSVATMQASVMIVTPTPITPVAKPKITFVASSVEVVQGTPVAVSWDVSGADELSISQGIIPTPVILEGREAKGTAVVSLSTPGDAEIILKAKAIRTESTAIATRVLKVKVLEPTGTPTPTPIPAAQGTLRLEGAGKVTVLGNNRYQVPINTFANVVWEITNKIDGKTKTEIKNQSLAVLASGGDKGVVEVRVNRNSQYQLWATNDPNQPLVQIATIDVVVQVPPKPPPPVNVTVTISDGIGVQMPAIIRWQFVADTMDGVLGFRIYRTESNDPESPRFLVADENQLKTDTREWTDNLIPTCGKTYYVTVVYRTYTEDGDEIRSQTDASGNSYVSPGCPTQ